MARGSKRSDSKMSKSAPNTEDVFIDADQSQILNTQSFPDLSRNIQAAFGKLSGDTPKKNSSKQQRSHKTNIGQKTAPKSVLQKCTIKVHARGKKRDSRGVVKEPGNHRSSENPTETRTTNKDVIEKEVYSLGGTAEDLDLVASLDSDSELDDERGQQKDFGETKFEEGLKKGIADILKQINEHGRSALMETDKQGEEDEDEEEQIGGGVSHAALPAGDSKASKSRPGNFNLLVAPRSDWFNAQLPPIKSSDLSNSQTSSSQMQQLYEYAKSLLNIENENFKASQQSSSSQNFYFTVIASGTLSDKISALTLAVQESPLHNVRALETLINLGKKRSRAQAVDVLRALKDLFAQGSLLPSDRKLHAFSAHPSVLGALANIKSWKPVDGLPGTLQPQHLIVWAYESWLKEMYFEVLKTLEIWCNDEIDFSKSRAVSFVFELLKEKPEQESNLLRLLINKLGDPSKKIASQASYLLMQLMAVHPLMKLTIISSIDSDILFRPGQSLHAKYYAAITLNQTALSSKEEDLASKLLSIYFNIFIDLLKPTGNGRGASNHKSKAKIARDSERKSWGKHLHDSENAQAEDLREKLTSAVLTGINRAYPYTESNSHSLRTHLETLFKITHSSNSNTSIQAMMLIQQLCSSHQASADRFYRTLYESLLDARLMISSKQNLYLNLLFKSLKADTNVKRVKAFTKRTLQVLALHQPSFICGCFFLLQELSQAFPGLSALIDQPEEHDMGEEVFEDVQEADDEAPMLNESQIYLGKGDAYDSRKRDPEHSNAQNSCLWEVIPFLAHYHPSVSASAEHIIRHAKLPGKPDLELHTLIHFLDRFAYRNAKLRSANLRGSSIMQPLAGGETAGLLVSSVSDCQLPVNSEKFWNRKSMDVPAEDAFFHRYFNSLGKTTQDRQISKKAKMRGTEDDAGGNEESEIWKAMMESAPDLEGAEESDQGLEMGDLESDFEESSEEAAEDDERDSQGVPSLLEEASTSSDPDLSLNHVGGDPPSDRNTSALVSSKEKSQRASSQRRKLKHLPTFASASDYAKMVDDDEEEDLG